MVVEDHWVGPKNYKNKYGRVVMITRKWVCIDFPDRKDFENVSRKKIVPYDPPKQEVK